MPIDYTTLTTRTIVHDFMRKEVAVDAEMAPATLAPVPPAAALVAPPLPLFRVRGEFLAARRTLRGSACLVPGDVDPVVQRKEMVV